MSKELQVNAVALHLQGVMSMLVDFFDALVGPGHPTVRLDGLEADLPICPQGVQPTPMQGLMGYSIKGTN
jgi:hypothetical protein